MTRIRFKNLIRRSTAILAPVLLMYSSVTLSYSFSSLFSMEKKNLEIKSDSAVKSDTDPIIPINTVTLTEEKSSEFLLNEIVSDKLMPDVLVSSKMLFNNKNIQKENIAQENNLAKLIIVIDDIGYSKRDLAVIDLPVTIAILPQSPHAQEWALKAHEKNREIIIHQPMLAQGGRFLEKNTLLPEMSQEEIDHLIDEGLASVPFAVGMNNHTGSAMTASLEGMQKVFNTLNSTNLFFLDSLTTGKSQVITAAGSQQFAGKLFKRDIFLDNEQNERYIEKQLDNAINLARKNGYAIAIGHPYQTTINVLSRRLPHIPEDIELIKLSELIIPTHP